MNKTKHDLTEMKKLAKYLIDRGVNFTFKTRNLGETQSDDFDWGAQIWGAQIIVFDNNGNRSWDAICGWGTYGSSKGLIEVMGRPVILPEDGDSVCGFLTADDVISRYDNYVAIRDKKGNA